MNRRLAFVGAGRMAGAMIRGILFKGSWAAQDLICTSAPDGSAQALAADTGISCTFDLEELFESADWIVLACKPQQLKELSSALFELSRGKRILSILAGTTLTRLRQSFPHAATIVRAMPNTPGMIGHGISAYAPDKPLDEAGQSVVIQLLSALGDIVALPEEDLDAVTGLSGSGPAYVFEFIAALRDGGIAAGLEPETAFQLALKTVTGAAALLEAVPETPETHRNWVSSPGGTTLAGLEVLKAADFRETIKQTVLAATRRSRELSGE